MALTRLSRRGVIACVVVLLLTLFAMPNWPMLWLGQLKNYEHFFPLLVLPGPLLALALWRYRDKDAWFLLLTAMMPQRWFFDTFILWLIPKSRREILFTAGSELGSRHLALVSHPAQLYGGGTSHRAVHLPADAGGDPVPPVRARRELSRLFRIMTSLLQTRRVFVAILALGLFTMAARGITDPDVWWHLRTGQLILQNHSLFHTDPYSFTRFGQPWINHEWLSEVLLFGLYRFAGFGGSYCGLRASSSRPPFFWFSRAQPGRPYLAALMTLWGAVASASILGSASADVFSSAGQHFSGSARSLRTTPQAAVVDRSADVVVGQSACGISHRTGFHRAIPDGRSFGSGDWSGTVAEICAAS